MNVSYPILRSRSCSHIINIQEFENILLLFILLFNMLIIFKINIILHNTHFLFLTFHVKWDLEKFTSTNFMTTTRVDVSFFNLIFMSPFGFKNSTPNDLKSYFSLIPQKNWEFLYFLFQDFCPIENNSNLNKELFLEISPEVWYNFTKMARLIVFSLTSPAVSIYTGWLLVDLRND